MDSVYPFGIFKHFSQKTIACATPTPLNTGIAHKLWYHIMQTDWIPNPDFGFLEDSEPTDYLYSIQNQAFKCNSTKPIKLTDIPHEDNVSINGL